MLTFTSILSRMQVFIQVHFVQVKVILIVMLECGKKLCSKIKTMCLTWSKMILHLKCDDTRSIFLSSVKCMDES